MASFILVDRHGSHVGIVTDRPEFATLAGAAPHMAPTLAGIENGLSRIERYAQSPQGRAFEKAWTKFWLSMLFSIVVVTTSCLPLFFRTLMHPIVIRRYRRNAWVTLALGMAGLAISGLSLAGGAWKVSDGLGPWSWCAISLTVFALASLLLSVIQQWISGVFPAAALSSGTGWPSLLAASLGRSPGAGWASLQDMCLGLFCFFALTVLSHDPSLSAVFAGLGTFVVMLPVWILGWLNGLKVVAARPEGGN